MTTLMLLAKGYLALCLISLLILAWVMFNSEERNDYP